MGLLEQIKHPIHLSLDCVCNKENVGPGVCACGSDWHTIMPDGPAVDAAEAFAQELCTLSPKLQERASNDGLTVTVRLQSREVLRLKVYAIPSTKYIAFPHPGMVAP